MSFCRNSLRLGVVDSWLIDSPSCLSFWSTSSESQPVTTGELSRSCGNEMGFFIMLLKIALHNLCPSQEPPLNLVLLPGEIVYGPDKQNNQSFYGALTSGHVHVYTRPTVHTGSKMLSTSSLLQKIILLFPILYRRYNLIIGPKALVNHGDSWVTVLFSPLCWNTWLGIIFSGMLMLLFELIVMRIRRSGQFRYLLGQFTSLAFIVYCCNLQAIISQPPPSRLPFTDLQDLAKGFRNGNFKLAMQYVSQLRYVTGILPGIETVRPIIVTNGSESQLYDILESSKDIFAIDVRNRALKNLWARGTEVFTKTKIYPLPTSMIIGGYLASRKVRKLGRELSKLCMSARPIYRSRDDTSLEKERQLRVAAEEKPTVYVEFRHLKFVFCIIAFGYILAFCVLLLEIMYVWLDKSCRHAGRVVFV